MNPNKMGTLKTIKKLNVLISFLAMALTSICILGCDDKCDEDCAPALNSDRPSPTITSFTVKQGGKIISKTDTSAEITVYRNNQLKVVYGITIPFGFSRILHNDQFDSISFDLDNQDTLANVKVNFANIRSGIPLHFMIMDRNYNIASFTINPVFEPGIDPSDIHETSWEKMSFGNISGDILPLCVTFEGTLFGNANGKLMKLKKSTNIWSKVVLADSLCEVGSMVVHPSGDLFALACVENIAWGSPHSIMKSSNDGNSWSPLKANYRSHYSQLKVSQEGTLFLNVKDEYGNRIRRSLNGENWTWTSKIQLFDNINLLIYDYFIINDSIMHAIVGDGTGGLCYQVRSVDYGMSWKSISGQTPFGDLLYASDGRIFVTSKYSCSFKLPGVIYVSNDLGESWTILDDGLPQDHSIQAMTEGGDGKIYVAPEDYGVFRLEENRWKSLGTELAPYNVPDLINYGDEVYAFTQTNGIYKLK